MKNEIVFILDKDGNPLMPSTNLGKIKWLLKRKEAKIIHHEPFFTIQLLKESKTFTKDCSLGVDCGFKFIGFSAVMDDTKKEIVGGHLELDMLISERLNERAMHRNKRRASLRYRESRFDNRTRTPNWLPPSIQHKIDAHIKLILFLLENLPIKTLNIEIGSFDLAKIINPDITNEEYQIGIKYGFFNTREAVLFRDDHKCQNPNCKNKVKQQILEVHHIKYRSLGGSDSPTNLITLCNKCHTNKNHNEGNFLWNWKEEKKKAKTLKDSTFMNYIKKYVYYELKNRFSKTNLIINSTFGFSTKDKRIKFNITKSHHNDAFVIAGGTDSNLLANDTILKTERRNNRVLETFRDAKYIDSRDNIKKNAKDLNSGRKKRNENLSTENERKYRLPVINEKTGKKDKASKGMRIKCKGASLFSPKSKVLVLKDYETPKVKVKKGDVFICKGTSNVNKYVLIDKDKQIPLKICKKISHRKGIIRK